AAGGPRRRGWAWGRGRRGSPGAPSGPSAAGPERRGGAVDRVDDLPLAVLVLEDEPHVGPEPLVVADDGVAERPVAHRGAEGALLHRLDHRLLVGRAGGVDRVG